MTRLLPLALGTALLATACAPAGLAPAAADSVTLQGRIALDNGAGRSLLQFATPAQNPAHTNPGHATNANAGTAWALTNVSKVRVSLFRGTTAIGTPIDLTGDWSAGSQGLSLTALRHSTAYRLVVQVYGDDGYSSYTQARVAETDADGNYEGERRIDAAFAASLTTLAAAVGGAYPANTYDFTTGTADYYQLGAMSVGLRTKNYVGDAETGGITLTPGTVIDPSDASAAMTRFWNVSLDAAALTASGLDTGIDVPNGKTATVTATGTITANGVTYGPATGATGDLNTYNPAIPANGVMARLGGTGSFSAYGAPLTNSSGGVQRLFLGVNKSSGGAPFVGSFATRVRITP